MLIITIAIILFTIGALLVLSGFKRSKYLIGMYLSIALLLIGNITYIIKTGGYSQETGSFLVISRSLAKYIAAYPIASNSLSFLIEIGRMSFVLLVLINVMNLAWRPKKFISKNPWFYIILILPIAALLTLSYPRIYYEIFAYRYSLQNVFSIITYAVLGIYLIVSILLYIMDISEIKLSWYKSRLKNLFIANCLLIFFYLLFAYVEPINIIQDYSKIQLNYTFFYFSSKVGLMQWIGITIIGVIAIIWASYEIVRFVKHDYDKDKLEISVKKKVSSATVSSTALIHGMKNQILAAKLLSNKANTVLNSDEPDIDEAIACTEKLIEINQNMIERMSLLYSSLRETNVTMRAVDIGELIDKVKAKVKKKNTNACIKYNVVEGILICDIDSLSEAVYNLIINSCDALDKRQNPTVEVDVFFTRSHTVIRVNDNGSGIPKDKLNKVFMPFVSTKNSNNNWGMGLCYVQRIVKSHMGSVRIESTFGTGTSVHIVLPKYDESEI